MSGEELGDNFSIKTMKPLLPSLREKKRYLVYKIISKEKISGIDANNAIMEGCLQFLGELGVGKAGLIPVKEVYKDNQGVLKVNTKYVNEVKMSLGLIKEIKGSKVVVDTLSVSGTLKKAQQRYLEV
tara:strand:+ start:1572 stop:1952 length:381 start_codon:yes stop_codon:yes gene_type:complete